MTNRSRALNAGSTTEPKRQLTDEQWLLIADLFANDRPGPEGGRPRVPPRRCVEGILWVLRSGARWKDLPQSFPSYPTCWRRLQQWTALGLWQKAWTRLLRELADLGQIQWEESIADGMFSPAKKGGSALI